VYACVCVCVCVHRGGVGVALFEVLFDAALDDLDRMILLSVQITSDLI
jgi:hypothetical protein